MTPSAQAVQSSSEQHGQQIFAMALKAWPNFSDTRQLSAEIGAYLNGQGLMGSLEALRQIAQTLQGWADAAVSHAGRHGGTMGANLSPNARAADAACQIVNRLLELPKPE